jgi:hypothetical protein
MKTKKLFTLLFLVFCAVNAMAQKPSIELRHNGTVTICEETNKAMLEYDETEGKPSRYKVVYDFNSDTQYQIKDIAYTIIQDSKIELQDLEDTPAGTYTGNIYVKEGDNGEDSEPIKFSLIVLYAIEIIEKNWDGGIIECHNTEVSLSVKATGGMGGDLSYQWEKKLENGTWESVRAGIGNEFATFDIGKLESSLSSHKDYSYQCRVSSGNCKTKDSGVADIRILRIFSAKEINSDTQTKCINDHIEPITASSATGGLADIYYSWFRDGVEIPGTNSASYTPNPELENLPNTGGSYLYTRKAHDSKCNTAWELSDGQYTLNIKPYPAKPEIIGSSTICQGTQLTTYNISRPDNEAKYIWTLNPSNAGIIIGKDEDNTEISITWNTYMAVTLQVQAEITSCFSDPSVLLPISVKSATAVAFVAPMPKPIVCSNEKELHYEVTNLPSATYAWELIGNGKITSEETNNWINVDWDTVTEASKGEIKLKVTNKSGDDECEFILSETITISPDITPDLEEIAVKNNELGKPSILIYPNPTGNFVYQWYANGEVIPDANKQFYYPEKHGNTLLAGVEYKVRVSNAHSQSCVNFMKKTLKEEDFALTQTKPFSVSPNPISSPSPYINVSFNSNLEINNAGISSGTLSIYSLVGEKIWEQTITNLENISIPKNMPAGVYIVSISIGEETYSEKIVVK